MCILDVVSTGDDIKYAYFVSNGEGLTLFVRLSGGLDALIEPPFMVFLNKGSNPIRGVPDDVKGVAYRTGPNGWMNRKFVPQWLSEQRVIRRLPNQRRLVLFVDNFSVHSTAPDLLEMMYNVRTEVKYFPSNVTHLIQPCDSFLIQKLKLS